MAEALRFLEPSEVRFSLPDGMARMRVEITDDRCLIDAIIRRAFPMSRPDSYLSIQTAAGDEVGILRGMDGLDHESRKLVEQEIDRRYFTPKILQVRNLKQEGGMWTFEVLSSRGPATFFVRNWRDSSHEMSPGRFVIQSVDGQRFEVTDYEKLDQRSQTLIEQLF